MESFPSASRPMGCSASLSPPYRRPTEDRLDAARARAAHGLPRVPLVEPSPTLGIYLEVPTVRLRDWLDRDVDLLKMDIEGAEVEVLLDCADRLDRVASVAPESHSVAGRPQRLGELIGALEGAGHRVIVQGDMVPDHPLVDAPADASGMDMRLNVYARRPA